MRKVVLLFKPKPVHADFSVLDKDKGHLWPESGYCSNILNLLWSWESAIKMWTGDGVVPGGSAGNQDGCQAGGIYLKMALGACSHHYRGCGRRTRTYSVCWVSSCRELLHFPSGNSS